MREQLYACEPSFILAYLDRMENASEEEIKLAAQMFDESPPDEEDDLDEEEDEEGNVRVKIEGPLSMSGPSPLARLFGMQGTSYNSIIAWTKKCRKKSKRPKSVAFAINSPGGEVAGVDLCWQSIRALAEEIPTRAEITGMCASAAYWVASACPQIIALSPSCEQGSIGIKIVAIDDSGMRDAIGIKKVTIVSKNAPKKTDDVSKKEARDVLQDRCDAMESVFISRVAQGRRKTAEYVAGNYGQGALLIAAEAKRVGMIDAVRDSMSAEPVAPDNPNRRTAEAPAGRLAAQTSTPQSTETKPPAGAGNQEHRRVQMPSLTEFLASDANARAEHATALKAEFDKGKATIEARIAAAKPFLALTATKEGYDAAEVAQIGKAAIDVIVGTEDPGALRGFVRMVDMNVEKRKQAAAVAEGAQQKETPGQQHTLGAGQGVIGADGDPAKAEADFQALLAREKAASGVK